MNVVLYTTGCPKCVVLKSKLDNKSIKYDVKEGEEEIKKKGFLTAPLLEVDGKIFEFMDAINWINQV